MRSFRHYLTTRFNAGIYGPTRLHTPEQWMEHRWKLFTAITLPSIMEQTCRIFTWLILMDKKTPEFYLREMESFRYPNLKLIFPTQVKVPWLQAFDPVNTTLSQPGSTTTTHSTAGRSRLFRKLIRPRIRIGRSPGRSSSRLVDPRSRPPGCLCHGYWFNNCPTLVEDSREPQTIWHWDHSNIPPEIQRCYVRDKPYWLQVVHSQNVLNEIPHAFNEDPAQEHAGIA